MQRSFFNEIEKKTGVSMEEIFALANAIQHADFQNEKQVRKIVRRVGKMTNRQVPQEMEDRIVKSIVADGKSLDLDSLSRMIK